MIHVYTGDGKGKTTASLGLALRAVGRGFRVVLVQLLKGSDTGELRALARLPEVTVLRNSRDYGFWQTLTPEERRAVTEENNANLRLGLTLTSEPVSGRAEASGGEETESAAPAADGITDAQTAIPADRCLLILDEACAAYQLGAVDRELLLRLLDRCREAGCPELILTGRGAPACFLDRADYITELRCVRHPFEKGLPAREGVEY